MKVYLTFLISTLFVTTVFADVSGKKFCNGKACIEFTGKNAIFSGLPDNESNLSASYMETKSYKDRGWADMILSTIHIKFQHRDFTPQFTLEVSGSGYYLVSKGNGLEYFHVNPKGPCEHDPVACM